MEFNNNMADFGIWTKNVDIQAKAGTNANATAKATTATDVYVLEIESLVNCLTRFNWSDEYAGLNDDVKHLLKEVDERNLNDRWFYLDGQFVSNIAETEIPDVSEIVISEPLVGG